MHVCYPKNIPAFSFEHSRSCTFDLLHKAPTAQSTGAGVAYKGMQACAAQSWGWWRLQLCYDQAP